MTDEDDKSVEELAAEEPSLSDLVEEANALRALIKSQGWTLFLAFCEDQKFKRERHLLLDPLHVGEGHPLKAVFAQEFTKGEYEGISTMLAYPEIRIKVIEEELEHSRNQEEKEKSDEQSC